MIKLSSTPIALQSLIDICHLFFPFFGWETKDKNSSLFSLIELTEDATPDFPFLSLRLRS